MNSNQIPKLSKKEVIISLLKENKIIQLLLSHPHIFSIILAILISTLILFPIVLYVDTWYEAQLIKEKKSEAFHDITEKGALFSNAIIQRVYLLDGSYAFVQVNPTIPELKEKFDGFAAALIKDKEGVRNIGIYPNGIGQFIYPQKGNKAAIGYNLFNDSRQEVIEDLIKTQETGSVVMSGPYNLTQGGFGLVARRTMTQNGSFWGFITVVMDIPPLLADSQLQNDPVNSLQYVLKDDKNRIFLGNESSLQYEPVTIDVPLPGESWTLALSPQNGWKSTVSSRMFPFRLIEIFIIILVIIIIYLIITKHLGLAQLVRERTREIEEQAEKLQLMVKSAHIGLWEWNFITNKILYSDEWKNQLGFASSEISDSITEWESRVHPDDLSSVMKKIEVFRSDPSHGYSAEFRMLHKNRNWIWILSQASIIYDISGIPIRMIGSHIDITTRKKEEEELLRKNEELSGAYEELASSAEEIKHNLELLTISQREIKESEERFKILVEKIPIPLCYVHNDSEISLINDRFIETFRYSYADIPTLKEWFFYAYPDETYRNEVIRIWEKDIKDSRVNKSYVQPREYIITCKNGEKRSMIISGSIIGPNFLASFIDTTDIRVYESLVRIKEELLMLTGEMAKIGGWEFDPVTQQGTWTDEVARIHDLDPKTPTTVDFGVSFYKPDSKEKILKAISDTIQSATPYDLELEIISAKGVEKWVRTKGIPILEGGKVVKIRGIFQDITERKKTEQELFSLMENLETRVAIRTKELEEANNKLLELDRLKSMFIASMSHELRTPLNSIIGFTGIILKGMTGPISEEQRFQLEMVKDSAHHLLALINDVIDISKIEADKIEISKSTFDLVLVCYDIKQSLALEMKGNQLSFVLSVPDSAYIYSDEKRVRQIIMNLVSNAIKYTDSGGITLSIEVMENQILINVQDTGVGIREVDIEKIFKPFSRIYEPGRLKEGAGLGLYLSQKLAVRLSGMITVTSEHNKGSLFTLILPNITEEAE